MKPHFGQSDAAMNKLAGCNSFPNAGKTFDLTELEQKARSEGFETPFQVLAVKNRTDNLTPVMNKLEKYRDALECIANTPDDYEMEYCREIAIEALYDNYDPSPYCSQCGAMKQISCKCGPIADNE